MIDPILCIGFSIQCRGLDVYIFIRGVKIDVSDGCGFVRKRGGDRSRFEVWRYNKIDVLTWIGKEPHHAESHEGAHGTRVVVTRQSVVCGGKERWNVEMGAAS